ncbi:hypothetical protein [Polaribacter sp.]|uniref:hypothetical protein n=1 Tax=Polaribacter sp. TaxID=1920175 RepID=UPI003EF73229
MKAKWYLCTLFLLFICFSAFQEEVTIPNQEIVLEFVDTKIDKKDIESSIAEVQEKLLKIGVANITINKTHNGTLKISYYSAFHIDNIKEKLAQDHTIVLNKNSDPKEKNNSSSKYNIDIHELTNETDISNADFHFVIEVKYNSDKLTTYNSFAFIKKTDQVKANTLFKTTYKVNKNNYFIKDRTAYNEPEVRAGPQSFLL